MAQTQDPSIQTFDPIDVPRRRNFMPVDDMVEQVRPPNMANYPNPMLQLADALKGINPALAQMTDTVQRQQKESDVQEGQDSAIRSGLVYQEAVKRGLIPANASPWFQYAYKEQQGRIQGGNLYSQAMQAYSQWSGRDSDNPGDFDKFMQDFRQKSVAQVTDPTVMKGFAPFLQQVSGQLAEHHANYTAQRQQTAMIDGAGTEIQQGIEQIYQNAALTKSQPDFTSAWAAAQRASENPKYIGIKGDALNEAEVKAVINVAHEHGDPRVLDILNQKRPDGTPGPGNIPKFRAMIDSTTDSIAQKKISEARFGLELYEKNKQEQKDAAQREVTQAVLSGQPLGADRLLQLSKSDSNIAVFAAGAKDAWQRAQTSDTNQHIGDYLGPFWTGEDTSVEHLLQVSKAHPVEPGLLKSTIEGMQNGTIVKSSINDPTISTIKQALLSPDDPYGLEKIEDPGRRGRILQQWAQGLFDYDQDKNADHSQAGKIEHAFTLFDSLKKHLNETLPAPAPKPAAAPEVPVTPSPAPPQQTPQAQPASAPKAGIFPDPTPAAIQALNDNPKHAADFADKYGVVNLMKHSPSENAGPTLQQVNGKFVVSNGNGSTVEDVTSHTMLSDEDKLALQGQAMTRTAPKQVKASDMLAREMSDLHKAIESAKPASVPGRAVMMNGYWVVDRDLFGRSLKEPQVWDEHGKQIQ